MLFRFRGKMLALRTTNIPIGVVSIRNIFFLINSFVLLTKHFTSRNNRRTNLFTLIYKNYKLNFELTRRPNIWLMAADSLSVHSATTFALISFI